MLNFQRYCPKCGKELKSNFSPLLYKCTNSSCDYVLEDDDTIDIGYKSKGIAKSLSNLCPYPFTIDDVYCSSMEAFIQSLKVKYVDVQEELCTKTSLFCYNLREMHDDWRITQTVYWKGKAINRHSEEYMELLKRAYTALYNQSNIFKYSLERSKGYNLAHTIGCMDDTQTLLTPDEYISLLNYLRDNLSN